MTHQENQYPVDPVDELTIGSIPDSDMGPLFDAERRFDIDTEHTLHELAVFASPTQVRIRSMYCGELEMAEQEALNLTAHEARQLAEALSAATIPPITRFRQAVAEVDPAHLTRADIHALACLMQAALDSGSEWAKAVAAEEMAAADEFAAKADVILAAMAKAGVSTLGELFERRDKGGDK